MWDDFAHRAETSTRFARAVQGYLFFDRGALAEYDRDTGEFLVRFRLSDMDCVDLSPDDPLRKAVSALRDDPQDELPTGDRLTRTRIMYIEQKPGLTGPARIGRVRFSKTGRTIYYRDRRFRSLKGRGFKANYINVDSKMEYWISACRIDGRDTLYPGIVEIDEDVRAEYWLTIRNRPDLQRLSAFRSDGKYSRRRPR